MKDAPGAQVPAWASRDQDVISNCVASVDAITEYYKL